MLALLSLQKHLNEQTNLFSAMHFIRNFFYSDLLQIQKKKQNNFFEILE